MANMTRVSMMSLAAALNGDTAVADALGNVMNGSAMNSYDPDASSGSAVGVWSSIGTLNYVEVTLTLAVSSKPTISLPFTHQSLSDQSGVIPGVSSAGVAVTGLIAPGAALMTVSRYDGAALDPGTYYFGGCYESDIG
jgi:hypothetical protein